jgi:hypothetical protein
MAGLEPHTAHEQSYLAHRQRINNTRQNYMWYCCKLLFLLNIIGF